MSKTKYFTIGAVLLTGSFAAAPSFAGCSAELVIVVANANNPKVSTFDAEGHRKEEVEKEKVLKRPVLDCNEDLGLVKIELDDHRIVWLDRSEAQRASGLKCATADNISHTVAGANGADPCAPVKY
jgi:hypothetical protein